MMHRWLSYEELLTLYIQLTISVLVKVILGQRSTVP